MTSYQDYYNGVQSPKQTAAKVQAAMPEWMKAYLATKSPIPKVASPSAPVRSVMEPPQLRWLRNYRSDNPLGMPFGFQNTSFAQQAGMPQYNQGGPGYGFPTFAQPASAPQPTGSGNTYQNGSFLQPAAKPRPQGPAIPRVGFGYAPPQQVGNPYLPRLT